MKNQLDAETQKKVLEMVRECADHMLGDVDIKVYFSQRATSTLGRCWWEGKYGADRAPECMFNARFVELNKNNLEAIRWVVVHEVAHIVHNDHSEKHAELCREFGVEADGFAPGTKFVPVPYGLACSKCGSLLKTYYRKPARTRKEITCSHCNHTGKQVIRRIH